MTASNPHQTTINEIRHRLAALQPSALTINDDSAAHQGHPGAATGAGHFTVHIVSEHFCGQPIRQQHRMVYRLLNDLIPNQIHALVLKTKNP